MVIITRSNSVQEKRHFAAKNDRSGNFSFTLNYNSKDDYGNTYTYIIKEVSDNNEYIEFDTHSETVKVKVNSNAAQTQLVGRVTYDADGVVFTNKFIWEYPDIAVNKEPVNTVIWE